MHAGAVVSLACCARILQASIAWQHGVTARHTVSADRDHSGCIVWVICALQAIALLPHAAELPIVQPKIRQTTNVDSVSGAQVDPFIPRRITGGTPFVLLGFCNVLVRARRMCLVALGPSVHHP